MNSKNITQAAANKAAEEGGLPERISQLIFDNTSLGWDKASNLATAVLVFVEADRASRQVANKAEVEPVAYLVWRSVQRFDGDIEDWIEVGKKEDICDDGSPAFPVYATPPATTGASTVLTDERITEICVQEQLKGMVGSGHRIARAIEREVAAQAGQVAVPEDVARDAERYRKIKSDNGQSQDKTFCLFWDEDGNLFPVSSKEMDGEIDSAIADPSSAKESK